MEIQAHGCVYAGDPALIDDQIVDSLPERSSDSN